MSLAFLSLDTGYLPMGALFLAFGLGQGLAIVPGPAAVLQVEQCTGAEDRMADAEHGGNSRRRCTARWSVYMSLLAVQSDQKQVSGAGVAGQVAHLAYRVTRPALKLPSARTNRPYC